jgi:hypothetical protein
MNAFISMLILAITRYYFLQSCVTWCLDMIRDYQLLFLYPELSCCIGWFINLTMLPTFLALQRIVDLGMNMVFWPWLINLYGNRKFGNYFVSMKLKIWCKHYFVFIPSYHLHAHLHSRTPISIFARLTMSQVKILGMSWFVGIGSVFLTVTSGVLCAL